jgi:hypothetical protein
MVMILIKYYQNNNSVAIFAIIISFLNKISVRYKIRFQSNLYNLINIKVYLISFN